MYSHASRPNPNRLCVPLDKAIQALLDCLNMNLKGDD